MYIKFLIIFFTVILSLIQINQCHLNEYHCEYDCSFSDLTDCLHSMVTHFGQTFNKSVEDVREVAKEWCKRKISHDSLNIRTVWDVHYDYIVVGGGTAGIVVAARLAEDSNKKILLIEAGGPQSVESDIPGGQQDWNFQMKTQEKSHLGYLGNTYNISRGKAFGGCSMHNDMNYYRENPEFYDYWTQISGVKGWTWNDVLPYFKKSENNLDDNIVINSPNDHVRGGPLSITTAIPDSILQAYMKVAPDLGYPHTYADGREPFGSTIVQKNILHGVRQSTGLVFLEQNKKRNLHILGETLVSKILFNNLKRAEGVQFYHKGNPFEVWARKEVIISAGSIGSPKLLMLSGIGPKEHLKQMNISVMSDLNVGRFIYDFSQTVSFDIKDQTLVEKQNENYDNYRKYFIEKRGPLAYSATAITAFHDVPHPKDIHLCNGVVLIRIGFIGSDLEELVKNYKLKDEWKEYYRPYLNRAVLKIITDLRRPEGKGTIRLASTDPFAPPVIDPCYHCNQQDLGDFVEVFKKSMSIFLSPQMSSIVEPFKNPIPGCSPCADEHFCQTYVECIVRTITDDVYPNGGCPMGVANDGKSVVDERLRVFGVSGLRVIDSSVMPLNSEQSMGITLMIGEYGADMIKEDNP